MESPAASLTGGMAGIWDSVRANMDTYPALVERARAYRADPEVQAALEQSGALELPEQTLAAGESVTDLLADRSAFREFDADAAGVREYGSVRLNQLAIDHLIG